MEQRVQAAREKEWEKIVGLERAKVELEEKITEVQRLVNLGNLSDVQCFITLFHYKMSDAE